MAAPTDAEQAFLTMAKMVGVSGMTTAMRKAANPGLVVMGHPTKWFVTADQSPLGVETDTETEGVARILGYHPEKFGIVASTFKALTIERPELREHYDRAREAWEASQ